MSNVPTSKEGSRNTGGGDEAESGSRGHLSTLSNCLATAPEHRHCDAYLATAGLGRGHRGLAVQSTAQRSAGDTRHKGRGSHRGLESGRLISLGRDDGRSQGGLGNGGSARHAADAEDGRLAGERAGEGAAGDNRGEGLGGDGTSIAALARLTALARLGEGRHRGRRESRSAGSDSGNHRRGRDRAGRSAGSGLDRNISFTSYKPTARRQILTATAVAVAMLAGALALEQRLLPQAIATLAWSTLAQAWTEQSWMP